MYGEEITIDSEALFSNVSYEYRAKGMTDWSSDKPVRAGDYEVRIKTTHVFGGDKFKVYDFKIQPKPITIVYESTWVPFGDDPVPVADLVEGDRIVQPIFIYDDIGLSTTLVTIESLIIEDSTGVDVSSSYDITLNPIEVSFVPRSLDIKPLDVTQIYDGSNLTSNLIEIISGSLLPGHTIEIITDGIIQSVGTAENHIVEVHVYEGTIDVTANYQIDINVGLLNVTPRAILVKTANSTMIYDGTPLLDDSHEIIQGQLIDGHHIQILSNPSIVQVGIIQNTQMIDIVTNDQQIVTNNYDIEFHYGQLEVTPRPISIETHDLTKVYDGIALSNWSFEITSGNLIDNHEILIEQASERIEAGITENQLSLKIIDNASEDVTNNYTIDMSYGQLIITPRPITIQSVDSSKIYDGTPLFNPDFVIIEGDLITEQTITVTDYNNITNAGTTDNQFTVEIHDDINQDKTTNYAISYVYGTLTIQKREIEITSASTTKIYDGIPLSYTEHSVTKGTLVTNEQTQIVFSSNISDVGMVDNLMVIDIINSLSETTTDNYEITYVYGQLEITQRPITVKPVDVSKIYDGTALVATTAEVILGTIVQGHSIEITSIGSQINVGQSISEIQEITILNQSIEVTNNYLISFETGWIQVDVRPLIIHTDSNTKVYDGTPLFSLDFDLVEGSLVLDHEIVITTYSDITDVGVIDNSMIVIIQDGMQNLVTDNYQITYQYGVLEVTPRPISIQPEDVDKIYDGMSLTSNIANIIEGSLVLNHTIEITTNGNIIDVGSMTNDILTVIIWSEEIQVTNNYEITLQSGNLEVTPRPITIVTADDSRVYDDTPLSNHDVSVIEGSLVLNHTIEVIDDSQITFVGIIDNQLNIEIIDGDNAIKSSNYQITMVLGLLEITPRPITIITDDASKIYDDTALNLPTFTTIGTFAGNQYLFILESTSIIDVGSVDNIFVYQIMDDRMMDLQFNYEIEFVYGTLTVTARPITVQPEFATKVYDGYPLTSNVPIDIHQDLIWHHLIEITTSGTITQVGIQTNPIDLIHVMKGDIDVTNNYEISLLENTLEITPRPITVLTHSNQKVYDGTPLFNLGFTIEEGTLANLQSASTHTYTQITDVGIVDNILEVIIVDKDNVDVSNNYEITYVLGTLEVTPRPITIRLIEQSKVYDATPLTSNAFVILQGELVLNHVFEVYANGTITNVGKILQRITQVIIWSDTVDVTHNYEITCLDNVLEVTPRPITIETSSLSSVFDGEPHFNLDFDVIEGTLVSWHEITITDYASIQYVGYKDNLLNPMILDNDNFDQTSNYDITFIYGTLTVTPRPITIETIGAMKVYDGEALFNLDYQVNSGNLVLDHYIEVTLYTSITDVSNALNELEITIYDGMNQYMNDNYEIEYLYQVLEVTQRPITIKPVDLIKVYDGESLVSNTAEIILGSLVMDHTIEIETSGSQTNVGSSSNPITAVHLWNNNLDVTHNYQVTLEAGTLEVTPRPITIKPVDLIKVYDGLPLTSNQVEILFGSVVLDHVIEILTSGSQTNVGISENHILMTQIKSGNIQVTTNYDITYEVSTLEVTPRPITIETTDDTKVYDGTPLFNEGFDIVEGTLVDGQSISITDHTEITNVGIVDNHLDLVIMDESLSDMTTNYEITMVEGRLEVTPRPVTIKPVDVIKVYDGWVLQSNDIEITSGNLVLDHEILFSIAGTQLNVGVGGSEISDYMIQSSGMDVTVNYEITLDNGTLTVTPRPITIETIGAMKVYDGEALFNLDYQVNSGNLVLDHYIEVTLYTSITDVSNALNELEITIYDGMNQYMNDNYEIEYLYQVLEVTQRPITIKPVDLIKVYDGESLVSNTAEIILGSLVMDHTIEIETSGSQTNVGSSSNPITAVHLWNNNLDVTHNYQVTLEAGTLEVTPRPITIKPVDLIKVYDGLPLTSNQVEILFGSVVLDHVIEILTSGSQTNVGISENHILMTQIKSGNIQVTTNYDITYEVSTLEVTPRPITIETTDDTKVYDGTPLFNEGFDIVEGTLVDGQSISITDHTEITNVGIVDNHLDLVIMDESLSDMTTNYEITMVEGRLEVTPRPITIETGSSTKVYDGTELSNTQWAILEGTLVLDHQITVVDFTTIIDVGRVDNVLSFSITNDAFENLTTNYDITHVYGTLEVTPIYITIQTASDAKEYDGTPLSNAGFSLTEGVLLSNHQLNVIGMTEITQVGNIQNELILDVVDVFGSVYTHNYEINYLYGTLEITKRYITIETNSDSKVYDGLPLFNQGYNLVSGTLASTDSIEVISSTQITDVGMEQNAIDIVIINGDLLDVTSSYEIQLWYGLLVINQRAIIIKPVDTSKVYDGTPLTSSTIEVTLGNLVLNHVIQAITTGSQTNVGMGENHIQTAQILSDGVDVTHNYDVFYDVGYLEVTPRPISLETSSSSKEYDGQPLSNLNITVIEGSLVLDHIILVTDFTSITEIGSIANVLSVTIENGQYENMTTNYEITMAEGLLEIKPIQLVISTPDDSKMFDGTPLTNDNWVFTSGSVLPNHTLDIVVTGTITNPGKTFNYFDYSLVDASMNDVSNYYVVVRNTGVLEVLRDKILLSIFSESDSKAYDGTPLTNDLWSLEVGSLLPNHRLVVSVIGTITEVGETENIFTVQVLDENDQDVTLTFYELDLQPGQLIVFASDENGDNDIGGTGISNAGILETDALFNVTLFKVYSLITDLIYLRGRSYGDYNKSGFNTPVVYTSPFGVSPLSFTNLALQGTLDSYPVEIQALTKGMSYYLPYYASDGYYDNINDIYAKHAFGVGYTVAYVPISDVDLNNYSLENTIYSEAELAYRTHVYDTYLQLPIETRVGLLEIARKNGLDPNAPNIIELVRNYVQNAAIYNLNFKPIPDNVDFALFFLEYSREGICQHFAMAATVLYRALGIPARYVTGYSVEAEANTWVDVTPFRAHAWVEVYVDGLGWIPIEATAGGPSGLAPGNGSGNGSGSGSGSGSGEGTLPGSEPGEGGSAGPGDLIGPDGSIGGTDSCPVGDACDSLPLIDIYSANDSKTYDGTPLTNSYYYPDGTLKPGHSLEVVVDGSITQIGETRNTFTAMIVDSDGNDVSDQYRIRTNYGNLVVVPNNDLPIIAFQIYDLKTVYNGLPVSQADTDYWVPTHNLPAGYRVELDILGSITQVGKMETYIDRSSIRIYDTNNINVTNLYNVVTYYGSIEVIKRGITVSSVSDEKYYDGDPLTADGYYFSKGSLAAGDVITVVVSGSITEPGMASNTIDSIVIRNASGLDVTSNYSIKMVLGSLVVIYD
jgi:hypothetical protein